MHRHAVAIKEGGITPSTESGHGEVSCISKTVEDRPIHLEMEVPALEWLEARKAICSNTEMITSCVHVKLSLKLQTSCLFQMTYLKNLNLSDLYWYADKGECSG